MQNTANRAGSVMTAEDQEMRTMAHVNGNLLASCEECGDPIPVELTRCDNCEYYASCGEPDHDDTVHCCPDCERPNQFGELCPSCERERE